jgi:hypothetical protein
MKVNVTQLNSKQRCVRTGLREDDATMDLDVSSLMALMNLLTSLLTTGSTSQSSAERLRSKEHAHMENDAFLFILKGERSL